jgi:Tol biopolymer transport system component
VSSIAPLSPPALDRVIATCLAKDPKERWHTAHDVRLQLAWIAEGGSQIGLPAPVVAHRKNRERLAWATAALLAVAAAVATIGYLRRAPVAPRLVRFDVLQPEILASMGAPKIAPDGSAFAFAGVDKQGKTQLWIRSLDALEAHPLAGTEGVTNNVRPFWSADSKFLAYFVGTRLMKIAVDGGPPQKIADAPSAADGTWNAAGVILFDGGPNDPIHRVDAAGGVPKIEQARSSGEHPYSVAWPQFLPDGKHYLYISFGGTDEENGVRLAELGGGPGQRIVGGLSRAEFVPPSSLLFVRESTLVTQRFDAARASVVGEPVPVAEGLGISSVGLADFSASANGTLVYRAGQADSDRLAWLDLADGRPLAGEDPGDGYNPALSPDGRWLAVNRDEGKNQDIWLRDLKRGVSSRFTTDPKSEYTPLFTPDGKSLLFARDLGAEGWAIVERSLDTSAERVLVPGAGNMQIPQAITPDGRLLLYMARKETNGTQEFDLFVSDLAAGGKGKPFAATEFSEFAGSFSPDGKWLAYGSNESGTGQVYVQAFPDPGRKWQISTEGGNQPIWSRDGATLYYYSGRGGKLMRVAVKTAPSFDADVPQELFPVALAQVQARNRLLLAPDGRRLLILTAAGSSVATPTTVVLNWNAGARN